MTKIINGIKIAENILSRIAVEVSLQSLKPKLAIIVYNPSEVSLKYADLKIKKASEVGIECQIFDWSGFELEECKFEMEKLAADTSIDAVIVQLPTIGLDNYQELLDLIPASKDVDGLSQMSMELLGQGRQKLIPATPKAILKVIDGAKIELEGKNILIIGQGKLVGYPLSITLKNIGYSPNVANSKTADLTDMCQNADIIISAAGSPGLLTGDMIKRGAVVLDAGTSEASGKIVGDVDYDSVEPNVSVISKVPGGIGPVTVACLLENVIETSKNPQ